MALYQLDIHDAYLVFYTNININLALYELDKQYKDIVLRKVLTSTCKYFSKITGTGTSKVGRPAILKPISILDNGTPYF